MLPFEDRYTRQRRLAEVGSSGQERLLEAHLVLPVHEGSDIEREYLLRAGVQSVRVDPSLPAEGFPFAARFEFEQSRRLAQAAWGALANLRKVLGLKVQ
jgi:hypothetical protein